MDSGGLPGNALAKEAAKSFLAGPGGRTDALEDGADGQILLGQTFAVFLGRGRSLLGQEAW